MQKYPRMQTQQVPSLVKRRSSGHSGKHHDAMDFETVFLIGYNENICIAEEAHDQQFYTSLGIKSEKDTIIRPPKILQVF